ncbi:MAG: hypothetical protein GTO45_37740 [Candidatus Aminicenantes bacterium]|nr:hypothetical protein [Candidatus Aminicenantes bacterium]NIM84408.1 hypothetical protein [Candidatus Aminicenantes bacterium]NIN18522.1 hypothetical protein [Candidatus Aminicenantes bacterium]NIN42418.1 hypothetical protein [Candidatus Aminicenantes bacterium]NIN90532.1 hypothetical protein [Candidatus Aminicenantes bacterium]
MSNEIICNFNFNYNNSIANIERVVDALSGIDTVMNRIIATYNLVSNAEDAVILRNYLIRDTIQQLLDKYEKLKIDVPEDLESLAIKTGTLSTKTMEWVASVEGINTIYETLRLTLLQIGVVLPAISLKAEDTGKKWSEAWDTQEKKLKLSLTFFEKFKELLGELEGETAKTMKNIVGIMEGVTNIALGIASTKPENIITGVFQVIGSLVKLFEKDWGAAAKRALVGLPGVTEAMRTSFGKLAKEMKSTQKAYRELLDEFIKGANLLDSSDFRVWAEEVSKVTDTLIEKTEKYLAKKKAWDEEKKKDRDDRGPGRDERGKRDDDAEDQAQRYLSLISAKNQAAELVSQVGDAFSELVKRADEFGTHGSMAMLEIIDKAKKLREEGVKIPEVFEYINTQLTAGIAGLGDYVKGAGDVAAKIIEAEEKILELDKGTDEMREAKEELKELKEEFAELSSEESFAKAQEYAAGFMSALQSEGKSMIEIVTLMGTQLEALLNIQEVGNYEEGILSELLGLKQFVSDNEEVMTSISGAQKMLESFANTGYLTDELFKTFQKDTIDFYNQLTESGEHEKEALQALAPLLAKQVWYATQNKMEVEEGTLALVKQAEQYGINMDVFLPAGEKMVALLEQLVRLLGGDIPYASEQAGGTVGGIFADINADTGRLSDSLRGVEGQIRGGLPDGLNQVRQAAEGAFGNADEKTGEWSTSLFGIEAQFKENLKNGLEQLSQKAEGTFKNISSETGKWSHHLDDVEGQIKNKLPAAIANLDKVYTDKMSSHSIVIETGKWKYSLEEVNEILGRDLIDTANNLDKKYSSVMSDINVWTPEETRSIQATPIRRMNLSDSRPAARDGDIVFEHITIQSENGEEAVKDFMTAIKGNKYGVQNLIRKVAH